MGSEFERVTVPDVAVLFLAEQGAPGDAGPRAFARLERTLGPIRGRRFYGYWDPRTAEYHACVAEREGDDPRTLGLERDVIRGGLCLRARLRGAPADLYARIGPTFEEMERVAGPRDASRHYLEVYRREDEIDLLIPLAEAQPGR